MNEFEIDRTPRPHAVHTGPPRAARLLAIRRQARDQLGGLTAMFLLGMGVNLIGPPSEVTGTAKTATSVLLTLHVVLAIGLVAGAIVTVLRARRSSFLRQAAIGLVAVALTFLSGAVTVSTGDARWSYAMSVGFIASLWVYGVLYVGTRVESGDGRHE